MTMPETKVSKEDIWKYLREHYLECKSAPDEDDILDISLSLNVRMSRVKDECEVWENHMRENGFAFKG